MQIPSYYKKTSLSGINPDCIFLPNPYSINHWSTNNKLTQQIKCFIHKRQRRQSGNEMVFGTCNIDKRSTTKYDKELVFCIGVSKAEILNKKITGTSCPIFDYMVKQIVTIDAYKKNIL